MNSATPDFRGVVFDLDGTLYAMRWHFRPSLFLAMFPRGLRLPAFLDVRDTFAGMDFGSRDALLDAVSQKLAGRLHTTADEARQWMEGSFYPAFVFVMRHARGSRPGLKSLLAGFRAKGIHTAVLSDYGRVSDRLERLGIEPSSFDTVSSCEDCGALKPNARPFLEIAGEWGVPPQEVVVVGDRADTDGLAARGAGMRFIQVCDSARLPPGAMRWNQVRRALTGKG